MKNSRVRLFVKYNSNICKLPFLLYATALQASLEQTNVGYTAFTGEMEKVHTYVCNI